MTTDAAGVLDHLAQFDHWTFLVALGLVAGNVGLNSRLVSLAATVFLVAALGYDIAELYRTEPDADSPAGRKQ